MFILGQTSNSSVTFDTVLNNAAGSPFLEQTEEGTILKDQLKGVCSKVLLRDYSSLD